MRRSREVTQSRALDWDWREVEPQLIQDTVPKLPHLTKIADKGVACVSRRDISA